jgi:hypothetical protein
VEVVAEGEREPFDERDLGAAQDPDQLERQLGDDQVEGGDASRRQVHAT